MRRALAYSGVAVGLAVVALTSTAATSAPALPTTSTPSEAAGVKPASGAVTRCRHARQAVPFYRRVTWTVQAHFLTDRADRTPVVRGKSCAWARYAADEWVARAASAVRSHTRYLREVRRELQQQRRALYEKWRCIHEHEGAWNDPNGPYWGGLQMDMDFQRAYGPEFLARWGTADRWPVWAQLEAAERAYAVRGFGPWPTYYRYCA